MPFAEVEGIRLYYELAGSGTPVVVVPGLGSDTRMFRPLVAAVAERHRVLVFDPRGAGRSDKPDAPYSIEQMADDTAALLTLLEIPPATVVGYSMGGRIALSLTLRHRRHVERLVLAATSARTPPTAPFSRRWFVTEVLGRLPVPRFVDPQPHYAFERQRRASGAFDCTADLPRIDVPTLVVHGRRDHMVSAALAREMQAAIPGARFLEDRRAGHLGLLVRRRRFLVDAVIGFAA